MASDYIAEKWNKAENGGSYMGSRRSEGFTGQVMAQVTSFV